MLCWRQPFLGAAIVALVFAASAVKAQNTPDPKQIPSWDQLQDGLSQRLLKPQSAPAPAPEAMQSVEPTVSAPTARQSAAPMQAEPNKPKANQTAQPKITPPPSPTADVVVPRQPTKSAILKPAAPVAAPQQNTAEKESESTIGKFFDRVTNFITAKPDPETKKPPTVQPPPPAAAGKGVPTPTPPATARIATVAPKSAPEPPATTVQPPAPKAVIAQPAPRQRTLTPPKTRPPTEWDKVQTKISNLPVLSPDSAPSNPPTPTKPPAAVTTPSPAAVTAARTAPPESDKGANEPGLIDDLMSRVTKIFDAKPGTAEQNKEPENIPPPSSLPASAEPPSATEEIETAGQDRTSSPTSPTIEPAKGFLARAAGLFADFFKPYVEPDGNVTPTRTAGGPAGTSAGVAGAGQGDVAAILPHSADQTRRRTGGKPLEGVPLKIGLGQSFAQSGTLALKDNPNCFSKGPNKSWYCIDNTDWPDAVKSQIEVDTWLYRNGRTIVQFDSGRATRMYTLFPSRNVKSVISHFETQFGPATEYRDASMPIIGGPPLNNPSWRWLSTSPDRKKTMILEVREFDDERRMISDRNFGFIRLYEQGSTPIFRYLSETDLMLHQTRPAIRKGRK